MPIWVAGQNFTEEYCSTNADQSSDRRKAKDADAEKDAIAVNSYELEQAKGIKTGESVFEDGELRYIEP